jgi:hypothetical protein
MYRIVQDPNCTKTNWLKDRISPENRSMLYLASALSPYRGLNFLQKQKPFSVVKYIILNSLKLSMLQSDFCDRLLCNATKIQKHVNEFENEKFDRKTIGNLISCNNL